MLGAVENACDRGTIEHALGRVRSMRTAHTPCFWVAKTPFLSGVTSLISTSRWPASFGPICGAVVGRSIQLRVTTKPRRATRRPPV